MQHAIPFTGNNALRFSGSASSTGYLANSNDGSLLLFNGANSENTSSNVNTLNPRGVGTFNTPGTYNLATTYTGASGNQTRSATTLNDTSLFIADQGGLYTNNTTSANPAGNFRGIKSFGGIVYVGQQSSTTSNVQVSTISAVTGGSVTGLTGLTNNNSFQDFYLISSGSNGNAYDELYIISNTGSTAGTITKYSLVSGSWVANGSYTTTFGGFGIAAKKSSTGAEIFISSGNGASSTNSVIKCTDDAGYNANINITSANNITLYTAATGATIKGIAFAPRQTIRITEYAYSAANGEFIEFTNIGAAAVDMNGWSYDDDSRTANTVNLSAFGMIQPGESVILTESSAGTFRAAWNLCDGIKIIGNLTTNLGRDDEINLFDASGNLADRLSYGDDVNFPGTIRTQNISGYATAAGVGANMIAQWKLSSVNDAEGSYTSSGNDVGNPGKSLLAGTIYNPCGTVNGAPSIAVNVTSTTNFIDGAVTTPPSSPFTVSGVINDPTDPASTSGIDFILHDDATDASSLTVTTSSSNTAVVPNENVVLSGTDSIRNIKITPLGVGYSNITITVSDGTNSTPYIISYAASAASLTPSTTLWHTGLSDASNGIPLDDSFYVTGDDELDYLNVYSRTNSGLQVASYDYSNLLSLPDPAKPEVDVEAATKSTTDNNRVYWLGSMSNGKAPFNNKPNRDRLFATTVTGTGAATTFSMVGYGTIKSSLLAWGDVNGYDFSASAAEGVDSKTPAGFAAEGMVFGPDNTTLYIGLRAPLVPTTDRTKAVIAPIQNFETWFNNGAPSGDPTYGSPIELDLGQRGIRDIIRLSNGTYIIIAGDPGPSLKPAIYKWKGTASDPAILVTDSFADSLNLEGVMQVNEEGNLSLSKLQVISDYGDNDLYNDGNEAKDFNALSLRKFRSDNLSNLNLVICTPSTGDTTAVACGSFTWYDSTYTTSTTAIHVFILNSGCDSTVTLHLTINQPPVISLSYGTISCNGGTTFLSVSPTGGKKPYSYSANGSRFVKANTSNNIKAGTYTIVVMDANGCTSDTTIKITQPTKLKIRAMAAKPSCKDNSDGTITVTASGGTAPYLYNINNGIYVSSNVFTGLAAGSYVVGIKDANGCIITTTVIVPEAKNRCPQLFANNGLVSNLKSTNTFNAYVLPNPTTDYFTLNISSASNNKIEVFVTDLAGRRIYNESSSENTIFRFGNNFVSGVYILTVIQGDNRKVIKLIKSK